MIVDNMYYEILSLPFSNWEIFKVEHSCIIFVKLQSLVRYMCHIRFSSACYSKTYLSLVT